MRASRQKLEEKKMAQDRDKVHILVKNFPFSKLFPCIYLHFQSKFRCFKYIQFLVNLECA